MKFTKSIFGKEDNDIDKFNELDLDERSIVFYSESSVILYPYVEEIIRELQNRVTPPCSRWPIVHWLATPPRASGCRP